MKAKMMPCAGRLVKLIEQDANQLAAAWLKDVKKNTKLPFYHNFDDKDLFNRARQVYAHLSKWIAWETSRDEVVAQYIQHGSQRRLQQFPLSEVIQALILMRVHLWQKVLAEGLLDTAEEFNQALELNTQVVRYFDRAIYYTIVGFMQ